MEFRDYLRAHLAAHPSSTPQDVVKLCYQSACGAEHLLSDTDRAQRYFEEEYRAVSPSDLPLEEPISDRVSRIHLGAWKAAGLPPQWLFRMFAASASVPRTEDSRAKLAELLAEADAAMPQLPAGFPPDSWRDFLAGYRAAGMPALHHSEQYRAAEAPAYRIVSRRLTRILPVLQRIAQLPAGKSPVVVAIDGRAASGKSTAAEGLREICGASVVHMDDFFLPPALRTADRFAAPGGNVHYERFAEEVLPRIARPQAFAYRIFDCSVMELRGERLVEAAPIRVAEGSYSCHPALGRYADITVFSDISPEEQMSRILRRDGAELAERFRREWIPLEEAYFDACAIRTAADVRI